MTAPRLMSRADRLAHANHCLMLAQARINLSVAYPADHAEHEAKAIEFLGMASEMIGSIKQGRQA